MAAAEEDFGGAGPFTGRHLEDSPITELKCTQRCRMFSKQGDA
jgi:hypothetical protein